MIVDVFVLRRTTRIRIKSRKLKKRAVRALEAEIDAFVNCRKYVKEGQMAAKRTNETAEEKAKLTKNDKVSKVAKRANELQ